MPPKPALQRTAVLALHWQVNTVRPEGFFGDLLSTPVRRSGAVHRAARFHAAARAAGAPVVFTRFTVPEGEGDLARNTAFMEAVGRAQERFRSDAPGAALIGVSRCRPPTSVVGLTASIELIYDKLNRVTVCVADRTDCREGRCSHADRAKVPARTDR
ncbi:isochorismatase family protein [Streptomonospora litoralis]|uniref:Isochorismatase-like domain-containing protein n=1 Tax=Streptomonospora litoralis TaxID=2498135 RepID=A0A4P6Q0K7_9ACTN|nr:isochorismatase family protein [Streptomonospora litoralis]QBI54015.1 hypothetical protein EKD16_11150 [Streptomonospora litoralis]